MAPVPRHVARCRRVVVPMMFAAGFRGRAIGAAIGLTEQGVCAIKRELGLTRPIDAKPPERLEGETWVKRPDLRLIVSSAGRVASLVTGNLLTIRFHGERPYVATTLPDGRKTQLPVARLVSEAFVPRFKAKPHFFTPGELAIVEKAATFSEAVRWLPDRSHKAIRRQGVKLGKRWPRELASAAAAPKGRTVHLHPIYAAARDAVPRSLAADVRDDLISAMVLHALETGDTDMRAAYSRAVKERNRTMGTYRERSLDAVVGGTDGLRLIDTIASDAEHW